MFYLIFFGLLIMAIVAHEFGHLVMALLCGIKVEAFSIGFGTILLKKKIKNIEFRLSLLPFGGYCKLYGENTLDVNGFLSQRYLKKLSVLIAGVTANFLIACLCYYINYKNIFYGVQLDLLFYKFVFLKDVNREVILLLSSGANWILFQCSVLNLGCAILNILPIPSLDGGHIIFIWLEKIWKEKFLLYYARMNTISFAILIFLQIILIFLYWIF